MLARLGGRDWLCRQFQDGGRVSCCGAEWRVPAAGARHRSHFSHSPGGGRWPSSRATNTPTLILPPASSRQHHNVDTRTRPATYRADLLGLCRKSCGDNIPFNSIWRVCFEWFLNVTGRGEGWRPAGSPVAAAPQR